MTREEAINSLRDKIIEIRAYCDESKHMSEADRQDMETFVMAIKALEQEQKWIPVSESLPKVNGWYQCTVQVLDLVRTMELYYKNGKWIDNRRVNMFDTYDIYGYAMSTEKHKLSYEELKPMFDWTISVVAWKPLSEPYRAESEDEGCK